MNTQINRMLFKQTLFFIVLMYVSVSDFGFPADWRGRYSGEDGYRGRYSDEYSDELSEDSRRFEPSKPFIPNTCVWMLDSGQPFYFGSAWRLYKASQHLRKYPPEQALLSLYFSPRWRHVETVILQEPEIEAWQLTAERRRFLETTEIENWQIRVDIRRRFLEVSTCPRDPEPLHQQQMVLIPAGTFQMGTNDEDSREDEHPVRTVYVDAFYMDTTEVTNAQFKAFVDANPAWQKDRIAARFANHGRYLQDWTGNNYPEGRGNAPVDTVSWYAAMAYAEWVGKRLPTEAEWEYAARGGWVGKKYPNGDTMTPKDARYLKRFATRVARYAVNGYGLYDMAGNVREWCLDAYNEDFYDTFPKDGIADNPLSGSNDMALLLTVEWLLKNWRTATGKRVLRGGSHLNDPESLRVAARFKAWGKWSHESFGFRCVRSVSP